MPTSLLGLFALVSYIPDPLGMYLDGLRQYVAADHAQPHLTVLPPRPLSVPVQEALEGVGAILEKTPVFDVELLHVNQFSRTNILYLTVGEGTAAIRELHASLNSGHLSYDEPFDFLPHVTIGGPVLPGADNQAEQAWSGLAEPKSFAVEEIVALWAEPAAEAYRQWERVHRYRLTPKCQGASRSAATAQTS